MSWPRDARLLLMTRGLRMTAYGFLSVVLVIYLKSLGLGEEQIGWLLTAALVGDTAISLAIASIADRVGRKKMLVLGAVLMAGAGAVFAITANFTFLLIAATIGVLSPSDKEVGPFLSIEQAALAQTVGDEKRTWVFAWYNLIGSVMAAIGALAGGLASERLLSLGASEIEAYRPVVLAYGAMGIALAGSFLLLSSRAEAPSLADTRTWLGLHKSRAVVFKLSALFALDAFGGGFILQSIIAWWLHERFGLGMGKLGVVFAVANLLAAASSLLAARLARRFGLINTMVFTHLPSNVLLILIPFAPTAEWAIGALLARFCISQMDVPTRQSYTMAVVRPEERSAAAGITTVARSIGAAASPTIAGYLMAEPSLIGAPFVIAGAVKIVYDLLLYWAFVTRKEDNHDERT
jgi:MFS family permease